MGTRTSVSRIVAERPLTPMKSFGATTSKPRVSVRRKKTPARGPSGSVTVAETPITSAMPALAMNSFSPRRRYALLSPVRVALVPGRLLFWPAGSVSPKAAMLPAAISALRKSCSGPGGIAGSSAAPAMPFCTHSICPTPMARRFARTTARSRL